MRTLLGGALVGVVLVSLFGGARVGRAAGLARSATAQSAWSLKWAGASPPTIKAPRPPRRASSNSAATRARRMSVLAAS